MPIEMTIDEGTTVVETLRAAGWIMWLLAFCALLAAAIIIWKLAQLSVHTSRTMQLLERADDLLGRGMIAEALAAARESDSPGGRILAAGLARRAAGADRVARSIATADVVESDGLERGLVALATIAAVAPLLGMLGSVVVLRARLDETPDYPLTLMAGSSAAIAVTGILVAIAAAVIHNYLAGRTSRLRQRIAESGRNVVAAIRALEAGTAPDSR